MGKTYPTKDMPEPQWKDIPDFEGYYQASDQYRVRRTPFEAYDEDGQSYMNDRAIVLPTVIEGSGGIYILDKDGQTAQLTCNEIMASTWDKPLKPVLRKPRDPEAVDPGRDALTVADVRFIRFCNHGHEYLAEWHGVTVDTILMIRGDMILVED